MSKFHNRRITLSISDICPHRASLGHNESDIVLQRLWYPYSDLHTMRMDPFSNSPYSITEHCARACPHCNCKYARLTLRQSHSRSCLAVLFSNNVCIYSNLLVLLHNGSEITDRGCPKNGIAYVIINSITSFTASTNALMPHRYCETQHAFLQVGHCNQRV